MIWKTVAPTAAASLKQNGSKPKDMVCKQRFNRILCITRGSYEPAPLLPQEEVTKEEPEMTGRRPLSNARKVALTVLSSLIPGFGQLAGVIIAIVFMNDEDDEDRKSFGTALMVSSIAVFIVVCVIYALMWMMVT